MTKEEWDFILALVGAGMEGASGPQQEMARPIVEKFIEFVEEEKDAIS
jgi:hypothetical protein